MHFHSISRSCSIHTEHTLPVSPPPPAALFAHGRVLCWGSNANGALGIDSTTDLVGPTAITSQGYIAFSTTIRVVQLSAYLHVCALFYNGRVSCWGLNDAQQLGENLANTNNRGTGADTMANAVFVTFAATIDTIPIIQVSAGRYRYNGWLIHGFEILFFYLLLLLLLLSTSSWSSHSSD
jgi:hypothetical protein